MPRTVWLSCSEYRQIDTIVGCDLTTEEVSEFLDAVLAVIRGIVAGTSGDTECATQYFIHVVVAQLIGRRRTGDVDGGKPIGRCRSHILGPQA